MATTRIMPIHTGKGRSVARALKDVCDYMENPLKTDDGELISSYECDARTADAEFALSKARYLSLTGRSQGRKNVIAYHARQSFKPGEISPQDANRIGYELAMSFTKGNHAFIVCTHIDCAHIHNHIIWNSTALDCKHKWRDFFRSGAALRRASDILCAQHKLSVIKDSVPGHGMNYGQWLGDRRKPTYQNMLRVAIDDTLGQEPQDFEDFLSLMRSKQYTINTNRKHITFLAPGQKKPTRMDTLRGDHTEDAVRKRIDEKRFSHSDGGTPKFASVSSEAGLLIDIQERMKQGKGVGYVRWAQAHNLKQMAKTLIYLQEQGFDNYETLQEKTAAAAVKFHDLAGTIKALEDKLKTNASLQTHIINYSKTRATYVAYRKAGYSKAFRAEHEAEILLHQTTKKAFDEYGFGKNKKIPTIATLRAQYAETLDEKRKLNAQYREAKTAMRKLLTAKANVDRLLNISSRSHGHNIEHSGL